MPALQPRHAEAPSRNVNCPGSHARQSAPAAGEGENLAEETRGVRGKSGQQRGRRDNSQERGKEGERERRRGGERERRREGKRERREWLAERKRRGDGVNVSRRVLVGGC